MGLTIYGPNGFDEVWNSDTVAGGVIADVKIFLAGETATLHYPSYPGRTALIVQLVQRVSRGVPGVTVDTGPGYPRVTVEAATGTRRFAVVVR